MVAKQAKLKNKIHKYCELRSSKKSLKKKAQIKNINSVKYKLS